MTKVRFKSLTDRHWRPTVSSRPMFLSLQRGSSSPIRTARRPRIIAGSMLCAVTVVLTSCGSGPSKAAASPTIGPVPSTAPPHPPPGAAALALAAYRGMWTDMVVASRTSNYKSPLLPQHASGTALSTLVQGLARNQQDGVITKGEPTFHPEVTSLSPSETPTRATISDCVSDAHWLEYRVTGGLVNNVPGGNRATTAIAVDTDGNWKVTQLAVQAVGTC